MAMQNIYNYQKPKMAPTTVKNMAPQKSVYELRKSTPKDQYLEQKVMSAKPEELTLMLYEGMVRFIKQAMLYNDQKDVPKTHNAILRAQAIVIELDATLNDEYEVSDNLKQIYGFMNARLIDANLEKDSSMLEEVLGLAEELRDTWKEAMELAR